MALQFFAHRGEECLAVEPLTATAFFNDVCLPVARELALEWLPDVTDRAGLWLDHGNRESVLDELSLLRNRLRTRVHDPKRLQAALQFCDDLANAIRTHLSAPSVTAYVG